MTGVDGLRLGRSIATHRRHGVLDLGIHVVGRHHRDVAIFHQLEQVGLNTPTRDITPPAFAPCGQFVHLIEVDDPVLGPLHVAAGLADEITDQVVHIAAHIARLAELGGIGLHERHPDELGRRSDEVGLAHAGRTEEQHVLLLVEGGFHTFARHPHMLEMITKGHSEDLLGLGLSDDEAVEMPRDLAGLQVEGELLRRGRRGRHLGLGPRCRVTPSAAAGAGGGTLSDRAQGIRMTGGNLRHGRQRWRCRSSTPPRWRQTGQTPNGIFARWPGSNRARTEDRGWMRGWIQGAGTGGLTGWPLAEDSRYAS